MKNIQSIWRIALLFCALLGTFIFMADFAIDRSDYSLVARNELNEFSTPWELSRDIGNVELITLPFTIDSVRVGEVITLSNVIPQELEGDSYVFFRGRHQFIQAYVDGDLVYSYGTKDRRLFGNSPASGWIMIPLTEAEEGHSIEIQYTPAYESYSNHLNVIYYGDRSAILYNLVVKRLASLLMCIVLFVLGCGMIMVSVILQDMNITKSLYRLGLLSLVTSVWSMCIMNILQVIIGDPFALLNLEFLAFHLLLPTFLWFLLSFEYYSSNKIIHILYVASIILFVILELLQVMNIADYMETILYSHILIAASLVYLIIHGFKALFLKHAPEEVKVFTVSMLVLMFFLMIDLVLFYTHLTEDEGFFSRIGFLLFVSLWMYDIIRSISKMMVRIAKMEIFEQLAFQDQLTGIANRRSFEKELDNYRTKNKNEDVFLVAFDLNNLKYVNDHYGHESGDYAIKAVATVLQEFFGTLGQCYRIGGDEFFALVPATEQSSEGMNELLDKIAKEIRRISLDKGMEFSVASGVAKLSECNDDIDEIFRIADGMMYDNKARMKTLLN